MKLEEITELVEDFSAAAGSIHTYGGVFKKILRGEHDALEAPEAEKALVNKFGRETYERMKVAYFKYFAKRGSEVSPEAPSEAQPAYAQKLLQEVQDDRT